MRQLGLVVALVYLFLVSGCAVNQQVAMKKEFWTETNRSLGVAIAKLPEAKLHMVGSQGLLDIAINQSMTSELSGYLQRVNLGGYGKATGEVASRFQERGFQVVEINQTIDQTTLKEFESNSSSGAYTQKDFRQLKDELGVDRLVLLSVDAVGAQRSYYGFIPTGAPVAMLRAHGEIIDLSSNEVLWRQTTNTTVAIDDPWDQPPEYTNVGVAVQKVILMARDQIIRSLFDSPDTALTTASTK
ncbi:hypothetical protein [Kaarinaea lacus]